MIAVLVLADSAATPGDVVPPVAILLPFVIHPVGCTVGGESSESGGEGYESRGDPLRASTFGSGAGAILICKFGWIWVWE